MLKKKFVSNFRRIVELFTQKFTTKLLKLWVWDSGSEIRDPEKTYSGSRISNTDSAVANSRARIRYRYFFNLIIILYKKC
jgi:hypothetical protein